MLYSLSAGGDFWNVSMYASFEKIHGHGSILQTRVSCKDSGQKPATTLRARVCVPLPHVTVHVVQSVQSEYTHCTDVDDPGVTVVATVAPTFLDSCVVLEENNTADEVTTVVGVLDDGDTHAMMPIVT